MVHACCVYFVTVIGTVDFIVEDARQLSDFLLFVVEYGSCC